MAVIVSNSINTCSSFYTDAKSDSFMPIDPLYSYMSTFRHLICARPDFQFREPPPSSVKVAQNRSVYDFFISYRHGFSKVYAEALAKELREFGYQVYFAGEALGLEKTELRKKLRRELHRSSVLAIVGNKDMFDGDWVRWEMETFYENHWGKKVPVITEEMGSPISETTLNDSHLKKIRLFDPAAAIIYEEDKNAWKEQKPSSITIFCLLLVREFYRVELEFWHQWSPMPVDKRTRLFFEGLYNDRVCRTIMTAMDWPDRDYSLVQLKRKYLKEAREGKFTLWDRIINWFNRG